VTKDQGEVGPLSRRVMFQPVSRPLQSGIRFFPHPLPARLSFGLAAVLPPEGEAVRAYRVP